MTMVLTLAELINDDRDTGFLYIGFETVYNNNYIILIISAYIKRSLNIILPNY